MNKILRHIQPLPPPSSQTTTPNRHYHNHHYLHRSGRDGGHYGGGGCGGLEVFAFLAFLLALLDLFLDVNELAVDIDVNTTRRKRQAHFLSPAGCTVGPCEFLRISLLYIFSIIIMNFIW